MFKNSNIMSKSVKALLLGFGASLAVLIVFTFGNFWPTVKMNVKDLPIGIVSLDTGVQQPQQANIGKSFVDKLTGNTSKTVQWRVYHDEQAAQDAANNKDIYAYLVIPEDFTSALQAHVSNGSDIPVIQTYLNEGMNYSGVSAAQNILNSITNQMKTGLQQQLTNMAVKKSGVLPAATVENLQTPFIVKSSKIHSIGTGGSGTIPMMLSVFLWMGSLISMLLIWRGARKIENRKASVLIQLASGIIVSFVFSLIDLFLVGAVMGLTIHNYGAMLGFTFIIGLSFFLLQGTVLNWIGMKGWLILILIWLFGMPAVNVPLQFLNSFTKYFVYSWSPYRFSAETFRDLLYFDNPSDFGGMVAVIITSGCIFVALFLLSMFKSAKQPKQKEVATSSVN